MTYISVIRPILTYAATVWFPLLNKKDAHKIDSIQYKVLTFVISAYRTTSYECTHLLAGVPRVSDYIRICNIKRNQKKMGTDPESIKNLLAIEYDKTKNSNLNDANENFRAFFPTGVPKYFWPNFYTTQFTTGHGCFNEYLSKMGKTENPSCPCNHTDTQTPTHLLTHCNLFNTPFNTPHLYTNTQEHTYIFTKTCKYIIHTLNTQNLWFFSFTSFLFILFFLF